MTGRKQFDVAHVVDAAMRVFWEHGYADTSIEQLSAATGLGRGSLYGAFGSKDGLFTAALDHYATIWGGVLDSAVVDAASPEAGIRAFFAVAQRRFADPGTPAGCLLTQSVAEGGALHPETREHAQALAHRQYARVLVALQKAAITDEDRDDLARYVMTVNQGLAVLHRSGATLDQIDRVVDRAMTTIHAALVASPTV